MYEDQTLLDITVNDLAIMMGVRLVVQASRLDCVTDIQRDLHQRLMNQLAMKIEDIRDILALRRNVDEEFECNKYDRALSSYFYFTEMPLCDYVDVDTATNEYRVNDGGWIFGRPTREKMTPGELGPIFDLMNMINQNTPFYVTATNIY